MASTVFESPLLTEKEAAAYCRCKPRTLRYWRGMGLGPAVILVGDLIRYRKSDLDAWIEQRRQQMAQAV